MTSAVKYAERFPGVDEEKCYLAPDIPLEKLMAAIASFGQGIDPDDVIMLVDDTVFGSAREGLLLTREKLYYKEIYTDPGTYSLENQNFKPQKGFLKTFILDKNNKKFISITQISFGAVALICAYFNSMGTGEFDSANDARGQQSAPSGEKQCPFCGETIKAVAIKCRFCGEMLRQEESNISNQNLHNKQVLASVKGNQVLLTWQTFIDDFDIEKASRNLETFSSSEVKSAINELEQRMQHEDYDAGAILVAMNMFGPILEDLEDEQLQQLGGILGLCVTNNHARGIRLLRHIIRINTNGTLDYRLKRKLQTFLQSVSSQCDIEQYR